MERAVLKRRLTKRDTYTYEESEYTVAMGPKIVNMGEKRTHNRLKLTIFGLIATVYIQILHM